MREQNEQILDMIATPIKIKEPHYTFNGSPVPRVTEILGFIDTEGLLGWANYMGFKHRRYQDIMDEAANIGTIAHGNIEKYLSGRTEEIDYSSIPFQAFLKWWQKLNEHNSVTVMGQEESLVCQYFGGTYDMLLNINGLVYLIDFKTSNHVGYKYFMQLAAYRYMLYHMKNINIDGCLILQLSKTEPEFNEFQLDFRQNKDYQYIEECSRAFFSLVLCYYNAQIVKSGFTSRFGNV